MDDFWSGIGVDLHLEPDSGDGRRVGLERALREGTRTPAPAPPLAPAAPLPPLDLVRMIVTARILFPKSRVRLSAGRTAMSDELQTLCFFAGANSIFTGEKLLPTPNPSENPADALLAKLGVKPSPPYGVEFSITEPMAS